MAVASREALLALAGAAAALYALASLQLNHLVAMLVVSLWGLAGLWWWRTTHAASDTDAGRHDDPAAPLAHLATNAAFVDVLGAIAPLKRFDRARFRELGVRLDAFQKAYVYAMSGRAVPDVEGMKDAMVDILRLAYSLYVVVPRVGKHFYGDGSLWEALDAAVARLRETMASMVTVVEGHVAESGGTVPNATGAEPANRLTRDAVGGDLP